MDRDARAYFEGFVIPGIEEKLPDVAARMSIVVGGSVGIGADDERSDMEASIYLDDDLWQSQGWRAQIVANRCIRDRCPWNAKGSVICVSRVSQAYRGLARAVGAEGGPVPWDEIEAADLTWTRPNLFDLYNVQERLVLRDPHGIFGRLREATLPEKVPERFWRKWLLLAIKQLIVENLADLAVLVERGHSAEACVVLGCVLEDLFRIGFLVSKRYYPWRKHLSWAFRKLPTVAADVLPDMEVIASDVGWRERLAAIESVKGKYFAHITDAALLPAVDLFADDLCEELTWAERLKAWENANWRDWIVKCERRAKEAGEDIRDFWVFSLWGLT